MDDLFSLLTLLSVPGVGPKRIRNLIQVFETPERTLKASSQELRRVADVDLITAESIRAKANPAFAEKQIRQAEMLNVRLISFWDAGFPPLLKRIPDPPVLLYVKGNADLAGSDGIAIVGTRNPTSYGRRIAESLSSSLAGYGIPVISGMARGVDTAAHRGTLKAGGVTLAILGCGVDVVYPAENDTLYHSILEKGAVISDFPIGTEPAAPNFPKRNRIISGLSHGTVVVEAGHKSGALITGYLALEQNREVFAVPGPVGSMQSKGPNRLIKQGAKLIENAEDILQEIPKWKSSLHAEPPPAPPIEAMSETERRLWEHLAGEPVHIDRLAEMCDLSTSESLSTLLGLEIKGYVKQLPGMKFVRI